ncbi:MAG: hypothetical protein ACRDFC_02930, partial [Ignavibacteria bacterium]
KKPIAVLANKITDGLDHLRFNICPDAREINGKQRRVVARNGQIYYVITDADQLLGLEISDYIIAPRFGQHKDCGYIAQRARERMR